MLNSSNNTINFLKKLQQQHQLPIRVGTTSLTSQKSYNNDSHYSQELQQHHQLPIRATTITLFQIQTPECESKARTQTLELERHVQQHQQESKFQNVKDMLNNISKNPNSKMWKTCSRTLARIETLEHEDTFININKNPNLRTRKTCSITLTRIQTPECKIHTQ